ncbi:tetratricopeptide repeat protein [Streptomyces sp. NRRL F-5123]|uniref:tetratricopeptide repeat protein n=1 Tax=Streptomyces sp. NRRL F-5123 TaxID=1463856 RepID=UPI0007C434ED|nr:tetratricopeptide repeat protein [Streptomyces sp. NRRL F-5123]
MLRPRVPAAMAPLAPARPVISGHDGAIVAGEAGDIHQHHHYGAAAAPEPTRWPVRVGLVPPAADCFQERGVIRDLDLALDPPGTAVPCEVLTGMGGVGKTQLAARHARNALLGQKIDLLVWVTASSRQAVIDAYAEAAEKVMRPKGDNPARAAEDFLIWLEPRPASPAAQVRWLVVLDNIMAPADLTGLWPPESPCGRTVATTRSRDAALSRADRRTVTVGLFTPDEATAYLTSSLAARGRTEPAEEVAGLAADLGLLPLALSQTAAYLVDAGISCAGYRERLADRARRLDELRPATLPDDQTASVAAAWSLSLDRADAQEPAGLARPLLQLAAMLDSNGIPVPVLTGPHALGHLTRAAADRWQGRKVTPEKAVAALRVLHRLNLLDHDAEAVPGSVYVHQVIQRAVRDTLGGPEQDALARTAANALTAAWPEVERDTGLAQALRANALALARTAGDALHHPGVHALLYRFGRSLGVAGRADAAVDHFQQLADSARRHLGPDHPDTLATRHDLAYWRGAAGDAAGAVAAFETLLAERLRVLGPDHPHTLTTRGNLAYWQGGAGDVANATAALKQLLDDRTRVLGPDHLDTLATRHNIARLRARGGDTEDAAAESEELLADRLRVLGPDHPDTLATRHDLACWRGAAGGVAGAAAAGAELEELLADRLRVLGPDHPDTLATRHQRARLRGESADVVGAVAEFEALLPDVTRVLGPDHPQTVDVRDSLAYWQQDDEPVTRKIMPKRTRRPAGPETEA